MQKLLWYYRRLRAMSLGELAWRVQSSARDRMDRFLVGRRQRPRTPSAFLNGNGDTAGSGFRVCGMAVGNDAWLKAHGETGVQWRDDLLDQAQRIVVHRLDYFDLEDQYLGDPIVWNRDHKRGQDTPMIFSSALDYRDVNEAGDCKFVWEPNRHHHLVVLGRAYRVTGDVRFARAVAEQLGGWLRQNPYGLGMNWRSGLELGIRLINWVWALDLIEESKAVDERLRLRLLDSISRHVWEIDRKYSRGSSVNNHLIGEAAGVFIATSYFPNLKHAARWRKRSWDILNREILRQTHPDGGTVEQALGYHLFALQFFVVAAVVARATGWEFPKSYGSRLEKMFEFLAVLSEGGATPPMFGDGDDGYVLALGKDPRSAREWLAVGASLFPGSHCRMQGGGRTESAEWLLGGSGGGSFDAVPDPQGKRIGSRALGDSGYYLLQHGESDSADRISVVFDCGPLGMKPLAGHGHADALSFTLRAFGRDVLVDPGTYDYFSYPRWREYFRSTRAHNTLVVDGRNQSEMLGLFLWGRQARACCLNWEPTDAGGRVVGEHDGYACLKEPVIHRRTLDLNDRELVVRDDVDAGGEHEAAVFFHWAEDCVVCPTGANRYLVDVGPGTVEIELDHRLEVKMLCGSTDPIGGWVSRGYHRKAPGVTLVGRCVCRGRTILVTWIHVKPGVREAFERGDEKCGIRSVYGGQAIDQRA